MPLTVLPSGQIVSDAPAPENLDSIEEIADAVQDNANLVSSLTNSLGRVVAGAPSDSDTLEKLGQRIDAEATQRASNINGAVTALGQAQDNARNLAISDLIGTAPPEADTLGELYSLIPTIDDTLPLDSTSVNPVESQAIAEAIRNAGVNVVADMTITDLAELGGDPLLLADNQIVVLRQFGLSDISGYVDSRPTVAPVGSKANLWDGNPNTRINAASFSWQQFRTNLVRALFFRRMTMNSTVGRSGGFHRIANFVSQNGAGEVSRTFRDVTRGSTNSLWFVDSTGSDIYVTAEAWVEADSAQIQVGSQTATVGTIVAIPEGLATAEAPAGLYRYAQAAGRAYRLVPVDRTLIEYDNGKLELSEAPSAETTAAAYAELVARLSAIEADWLTLSVDPPDPTLPDWRFWLQYAETGDPQIFIRDQTGEALPLGQGGAEERFVPVPIEGLSLGNQYAATSDASFLDVTADDIGRTIFLTNDHTETITLTAPPSAQFSTEQGELTNTFPVESGETVGFRLARISGSIVLKEFPNETSGAPQVFGAIADLPDVTTQRNGVTAWVVEDPVDDLNGMYLAIAAVGQRFASRWQRVLQI